MVISEFHGSMASSVTAHRNSVVANCTPEVQEKGKEQIIGKDREQLVQHTLVMH